MNFLNIKNVLIALICFSGASANAGLFSNKTEKMQSCRIATNVLAQLSGYKSIHPDLTNKLVSDFKNSLEAKGFELVDESAAHDYYLQSKVDFPGGFNAGSMHGNYWYVSATARILETQNPQAPSEGYKQGEAFRWNSSQGDNVPTSLEKSKDPAFVELMKARVAISRAVPSLPKCISLK